MNLNENEKETKIMKYKEIYGIVCLIDALGAKNFDNEETLRFLESRNVIKEALKDKIEDEVEYRAIKDPQIAFFNDTIIIAIECKHTSYSEYNTIKAMGIIVRKLISDGISKNILFRGAIGVGKYYLDLENDTIIGKAVTDAANWYESINLIGCVLTPRLEFLLEKHIKSGTKKITHIFVYSNVNTKDGDKDMFCINWPKAFFVPSLRPSDCTPNKELAYLYKQLCENTIPKSTEDKYYNTIKFFKNHAPN